MTLLQGHQPVICQIPQKLLLITFVNSVYKFLYRMCCDSIPTAIKNSQLQDQNSMFFSPTSTDLVYFNGTFEFDETVYILR